MYQRGDWTTSKIGEYCLIGDGAHAKIARQQSGVMYLTSKNFKPEGLDLSKVEFISTEDFDRHFRKGSKAVTKPEPSDVLVSIIGSLGEPYVVRPSDRFGLSSSVAIIRPQRHALVPKYLYYWMKGRTFQSAVYGTKGGVAQSYLSLEMIRSLPLRFPSLSAQRSIVEILSSYDDLIENNTRRTKILEEIAQMIYGEWFVSFRFPGHEKVRIEVSELGPSPNGWPIVRFTDLSEILSGGTPRTSVKEFWNGDIPFFGPTDSPKEFFVIQTEKSITPLGLSRCNSELYPAEAVFITARGTVGKVSMPAVAMAMNQSCYALRGKTGINQLFLFMLARHCSEQLQKKAHGAVFDTITVETFQKLNVLRPPESVIEQFESLVRPYFSLMLNLQKANSNLRATRDLLLPRLISGEIGVEHLEAEAASQVS
jgi:type I restriction enzyme S subunit